MEMTKGKIYKLWALDKESRMWTNVKSKETQPEIIQRIDALQKEADEVRSEIYKYIESVNDPYIRVLINYRCIERRAWKWIAATIGGSEASHKMAFNRWLHNESKD